MSPGDSKSTPFGTPDSFALSAKFNHRRNTTLPYRISGFKRYSHALINGNLNFMNIIKIALACMLSCSSLLLAMETPRRSPVLLSTCSVLRFKTPSPNRASSSPSFPYRNCATRRAPCYCADHRTPPVQTKKPQKPANPKKPIAVPRRTHIEDLAAIAAFRELQKPSQASLKSQITVQYKKLTENTTATLKAHKDSLVKEYRSLTPERYAAWSRKVVLFLKVARIASIPD